MRSSEEDSRMRVKPLPDVLDEMDANIRTAAEVARRAEEAAKAAREAARAAREAVKAFEKATKEVVKKVETTTRRAEATTRRAEEASIVAKEAAGVSTKAAQEVTRLIARMTADRYLVVFEKANDNYSAYSPDIPGCIATDKTRSEVEKNFREAISFHFAGLEEDGLPLPEPTSFIEYIKV